MAMPVIGVATTVTSLHVESFTVASNADVARTMASDCVPTMELVLPVSCTVKLPPAAMVTEL